ncbi:MAG: UDP-N-acetylmuramate:L-alanyl-gamma-D-glutamyl-meso-diaminopimelate ligase [candidate division KSB1 bacterium]|nr:UDP-N-acetylmuramate:L-alanyl-gamma-D-glutamyl-meso-diaminopimelate ligase [candidate division KSB1 bacterium]MDZ7312048.1 UDP-N-acetylmuramate:L-alanyl-gamma-D-glutamyl-meso-diaminopimelate ligase [candidate division KSB1 bacterium]
MSQHIHFIGICGTGMAALAGMLKQRGHRITGSDLNVYPPMSTFLEEQQIPVHQGYDPAHLQPPPDWVIIGNAISRGNPEAEYVLNTGVRYYSLPEALKEFFIHGKYSCVVAGTHGKTTTSSLLAWTLETAGMDPSFFIGGIPENFGQGFKLGSGRHFVIEGDEYDSAFFDKGSKFFHYLPNLVILNNIEYDHADIFKNFEEVKTAFRRLINIIPGNGYLIACSDDPTVRELLPRAFCKVVTFGFTAGAEWRPAEIHVHPEGNEFVIEHAGEKFGPLFIPLAGNHNVKNATAVFAAAACLGVSAEKISEALRTFQGVRRRLQLKYAQNEVLVFDDFAHHPSEVRETLRAVRQRYPDHRLWAVFEPRTASTKRKVFEQDYIRAFDEADHVVFAPMHRPDKVPEAERLSLEKVVEGLRRRDKLVEIVPPGEEMANFIIQDLAKGDIILFMSNGDFAGTPSLLVEKLNSGVVIKERQSTRGRTMTEEREQIGTEPHGISTEVKEAQLSTEMPPREHRPRGKRPEGKRFDRDKRLGRGRPPRRGRHEKRPARYRPAGEGRFERSEDDTRINELIQDTEKKLAGSIQPVQLPDLSAYERKQIHRYFELRQPEFETKTYRGEGEAHVLWVFPVANLKKFAEEKAREALETDTEVTLPAMSSYERFIVHNVFKEMDNIETFSVGEGAERHIVIKPKKFGRGLKKIMKKIKLM